MRLTVLPGLMLLLAAFSAQAQNPTPFDCQITATLTATHLVSISYPNKGPAAPCIAWRLTYSTVNATGVSISLQGTTNLANGTADPAGWTNLTTPTGSTNPATGTNAGTIASCCDYYPWIRAIAGTFTGTNQTMSLSVLGYKGTSAQRVQTGPGSGLCNLSGSQTTGYVLTATDNSLGCAWTSSVAVMKGQCSEAWGGSGTAFALTAGDDAIVNNTCYNDSGATRTITAVKCRSDAASNAVTLTPTFGSTGTGTAILTGTVTCGNSYAYSATGTVNTAAWTTGTGIDPGMGGTLTGSTSIALLIEYTY